jgi:FAD:protein FMN transferase
MPTVALARNAMATRFEILLHGAEPVALRAAGEEALDEIERLDEQLSLYRPTSEIARLNARAGIEPVRVEPNLFRLLEHAQQLHGETGGAFDITVAPLMRCWGFMRGTGHLPDAGDLAEARANIGMHLIELDPRDFTVHFAREGVMLDLGAIGKGYALERAAELLREAGVTSAVLHGGTSTIYGIGQPLEAEAWKIAIERPAMSAHSKETPSRSIATEPLSALAVIPLRDEAVSVSAVWGKGFEAGGQHYGHVIDPRNGRPVAGAVLAAVVLPSATETDALSTALLTLGGEGLKQIADLRPNLRALVVAPSDEPAQFRTVAHGIEIRT